MMQLSGRASRNEKSFFDLKFSYVLFLLTLQRSHQINPWENTKVMAFLTKFQDEIEKVPDTQIVYSLIMKMLQEFSCLGFRVGI